MTNQSPKETVLAYHEAFYRNDRPAVRSLLADSGNFIGPLSSFTDPDVFLDAASVFMRLHKSTSIKQVITEGNDVCVLYDSTTIVPSIPTLPIASWFKVENGKIKLFHVHFDPSPIVKAQQNGDLAKALTK